ncbi:MAG: 6-bladed beta-propeller [Candidatus Sabulitectum sp.]|nr:6-bladed beta-propeller [Candidatus Sabulitectum sp.]
MKLIIPAIFALLFLSSCGGGENISVEEANASSLPADTLEITGYIGEELGDSTSTFGILADAEYHLGTGNILILDNQAACFKEYTPSGEYIRQISRNGSGPGELSFATFEFFQMGGNVLALNMMKQGFVVFDDSLEYLEEVSLWTQNPPMQNVAVSDSIFASYKPDFEEAGEGSFVMYRRIVLFPYATEEYDLTLWEDSTELTISDLISNSSTLINDFFLGTTLGGNSDLILFSLKESDNYTVHAWYPDGTDAFTITLPLEPVAKTPEEIADEKAYMEAFFNQMGAQGMGEFVPEPNRDMVICVDIGPDGNIWVQRGTMEQPFFDIFDMEGTLIGHKVFPKTGWTWRFSLSSMGILAWEDDPELGYQQLFVVQ